MSFDICTKSCFLLEGIDRVFFQGGFCQLSIQVSQVKPGAEIEVFRLSREINISEEKQLAELELSICLTWGFGREIEKQSST